MKRSAFVVLAAMMVLGMACEKAPYDFTVTKDGACNNSKEFAELKAQANADMVKMMLASEAGMEAMEDWKEDSAEFVERDDFNMKPDEKVAYYTSILTAMLKKPEVKGSKLTVGMYDETLEHAAEYAEEVLDEYPDPWYQEDMWKGMTRFAGGEWQVGCTGEGCDAVSGKMVAVKPFFIDDSEVTKAEYQEFLDDTGYPEPMCAAGPHRNIWDFEEFGGGYPAACITWMEASAYCRWAGKRLPSEAEFMWAYTSGGKTQYPWGDANLSGGAKDSLDKCAEFQAMPKVFAKSKKNDQTDSRQFLKGLSHGVREWVGDYGDAKIDKSRTKVIKGDSQERYPRALPFQSRAEALPGYMAYDLGFRCAADAIIDIKDEDMEL